MKKIEALEIDIDIILIKRSMEMKKRLMEALSQMSESQIQDIDDYEMELMHNGQTWQFRATKYKPGEIGIRSIDVLHDYITPTWDSKFVMR